jgi:signal transduction histidine kinase/CheY-like chemotaxis protein
MNGKAYDRSGRAGDSLPIPGESSRLTPDAMASVLEAHRDPLLEKWEQRVLADPGLPLAPTLSRPALYDHFPAIIQRLATTLRILAEHPEELGRLVGSTEEAQDHVRDRMEAEYSVPEVLRELSHLRLAIVDLCEDALPDRPAASILHAAFDQMMINAADELSQIALQARSQAEALAVKQTTLYQRERDARQACEDAHRAKDQFLAMVSHELRTPLTAITGWAEMLKRHPTDAHLRDRAVSTIRRNAEIQAHLIDGLLDITRLRAGQVAVERVHFDLVTLLRSVVESFTPASTEKRLRIDRSELPVAHAVVGDEPRLRQVFTNLLGNAIKFTPEGGTIRVRVEGDSDVVRVEVSDSGIGIPDSFLPYVFEPFRQADSSWTRKHSGLGLGLAIAKAIIDLHGGSIEATSGGTGAGATFRVTLPSAGGELERPPASPEASSVHAHDKPLTGVRVLVVDDDDDARTLTTTMLLDQGCEVREAASAGEAYDLFRTFLPHVLATDLAMPGEDGISLLERIRAEYGHVPAIAISAFSGPKERQRVASAGFDGHVMKPFALPDLTSQIAALVGDPPFDARVTPSSPSPPKPIQTSTSPPRSASPPPPPTAPSATAHRTSSDGSSSA